VADAWLPAAGRLHSKHDGGSLNGGVPRAVWHTSENNPYTISARSVAQRLEQHGRNAHLAWNPCTGDIVQMVPATEAALLLPEGIGREGRRCFQIIVVGFAREPFTSAPMKGLDKIIVWLDGWGVPRHWPAGRPLSSPEAYEAERARKPWARGGHFGASQVPHTTGPAPGAIDIMKITGPAQVEVEMESTRARVVPEETVPAVDPDELLARRLTPDATQNPNHEPAPVQASMRS
jgi:hypothetical protein